MQVPAEPTSLYPRNSPYTTSGTVIVIVTDLVGSDNILDHLNRVSQLFISLLIVVTG